MGRSRQRRPQPQRSTRETQTTMTTSSCPTGRNHRRQPQTRQPSQPQNEKRTGLYWSRRAESPAAAARTATQPTTKRKTHRAGVEPPGGIAANSRKHHSPAPNETGNAPGCNASRPGGGSKTVGVQNLWASGRICLSIFGSTVHAAGGAKPKITVLIGRPGGGWASPEIFKTARL